MLRVQVIDLLGDGLSVLLVKLVLFLVVLFHLLDEAGLVFELLDLLLL